MSAADWDSRQTNLQKVFINGDFIIGYSWSFRMGQLLQYSTELKGFHVTDDDPLPFMVLQFVPAVREILRAGGYTAIENNRESGGEFLVGVNRHLFRIGSDFQVNSYFGGYDAIGCGGRYALGALSALMAKTGDDPKTLILSALEIAGHFSNGVCAPYRVYEQGEQE